MNFCSDCAGKLELRIPENDNRERYVCATCGMVHYQNPKIVVGTIPLWKNKILLCQRAIAPRYGHWTLPAGFHEIGESVSDGALRETQEEARVNVMIDRLYTVLSVPNIGQLHLMFIARLTKPEFAAGDESLDVRLFDEMEIPWGNIAFRTVSRTLRCFFWDRKQNDFHLHVSSLTRKHPKEWL
ncbi:MAG: NUDIX hydrolase [Burkholderiales bacterium]|jgi:ADP-ribose pyrophosphatase YjhB (NUDIX family)|nr:NUDIX hydrolase [Burkholderiales bacterium]